MRNIDSTQRLLRQMSQTTDPDDLARLFFDHIRQSVEVHRALVLNTAGLSAPQFRVVHDMNAGRPPESNAVFNGLGQGGLLAEILYRGEFRNIPDFTPAASDPAFDLLQGSRSLTAFPLFENGQSVGAVVMLGAVPQAHETADLCAVSTMISLLGRAIESQKLAEQAEVARRHHRSRNELLIMFVLQTSRPTICNESGSLSDHPRCSDVAASSPTRVCCSDC